MNEQHTGKRAGRQDAVRLLKFGLFSVSAGVIQLASGTLLHELTRLPEWLTYLMALVLSVVYNFTLNRRFTFRSMANYPLAMLKVAGYYAVFTPLSTWWLDKLNDAGWNYYVVFIGTMLANFVTEFLFQRFVVFRGTIDTNSAAQSQKKR